ncbi:MAG TPA: hypothetical protein VFC03_10510 [Acidimicrobiales bacterium]|nr:hypothetical protein [Acidimicrobiales bacterium]
MATLKPYRSPSAVSETTLPRKEMEMPKMVITHSVVDVGNWLSFKAERADAIAAMGGGNVVDLVADDGSNAVAITGDVDDPAAMMEAITSPPPELGAAMERHGVVPPLTVYIEK